MASNTENLDLLMKNPSTDGADTFNVQTMLNDNWQKIDNNAGSVAQTLANILKPTTPPIIGLPPSTTPDGMFQALGNTGELHVWRKTVVTTEEKPAGYTLGDAESGTAFSIPNAGSQNYVTLQYGPSITVNDAGGVSLTSVTGSVQFQQYSNVSAIYDIRNNFVKAIPNGGSTSAFDGVIFVPNDCSFKNTAGIVTFGKFYRVNAYPLTPAGTTTTYPVSTNPKAYQEGDDAKAAGYVLGDMITGSFCIGNITAGTGAAYYVASEILVSDDGVLSIPTTTLLTVGSQITSASQQSLIAGKFMQIYTTGSMSSVLSGPFTKAPGPIVYIPNDVKLTAGGGNNWNLYIDRYQPVTGYAAIPAGTTIEYLGKLGDKVRVQVVSYVGTGTYGSDHPNSLTFGSLPEAIIFLGMVDSSGSVYSYFYTQQETRVLYPKIIPNGRNDVNGYGFGYNIYGKRDGNTISWYSTKNQDCQANSIGYAFYYLVLS